MPSVARNKRTPSRAFSTANVALPQQPTYLGSNVGHVPVNQALRAAARPPCSLPYCDVDAPPPAACAEEPPCIRLQRLVAGHLCPVRCSARSGGEGQWHIH